MKRLLIILFILVVCLLNAINEYDINYINKHNDYDVYFKKYAKEFFGNSEWQKFKFQGFIESSLNNNTKSYAGAIGVMQIIPSTFAEIRSKISVKNIHDPKDNIKAGIYYMSWLYKYYDNYELSLMAYNYGIGNVNRIIRKIGSRKFEDIKEYLPLETKNYVEKFNYLVENSDDCECDCEEWDEDCYEECEECLEYYEELEEYNKYYNIDIYIRRKYIRS